MTDRPCPVSLIAILRSKFRPFTRTDWDCYAGVEGQGHIAEVMVGTEAYQIVLDHGTDSEVQVHHVTIHGDNYECWSIPIPAATQIL